MQQEIQPNTSKPKAPAGTAKPKRRRRGFINLLLFIGIIGAISLFVWAEQQRRDALEKLKQTEQQLEEIKKSTTRSGQQVADEVLGKLRQHMDIPNDPQPTVATIIDVDRLRETSEFYNKAKNGDHLILIKDRAILFDAERNLILDVVPVMLNPEDQAQTSSQPTPTADSAAPQTNPAADRQPNQPPAQQPNTNPADNNLPTPSPVQP